MPTNRQTILAQLETLDTATLSRLSLLSDKIIVPDADSLIAVGFEDMIAYAHTKADAVFPSWTDRSKADFGEFLVELFALFSWKDFSYMNIFQKEAFIRKANTYSNVALHALRLGYLYKQKTSSTFTGNVSFVGVPSAKVYPPGSFEVTYGNGNLVFTNAETLNVAVGNSTVAAVMKSGRVRSENGNFNGKSIRINITDIDPTSITLQIGADVWVKVNSFAQYNNTAKVYMVLPSDGNDIELVFGMHGYGLRPAIGDVYSVTFRTDAVKDKNVIVGGVSVSSNVIDNYIDNVVMNGPAIGGSEAEDIESIRENSSMLFRTYGTENVVVPQDAISLLESHALVHRATAFNFANQLYFTVILKTGVPVTIPTLNTIAADLNLQNIIVMGYQLAPSLTSPVTITELSATAYVYNEFDSTDITNRIRDYIEYITDPLEGAQYGVGLDVGELSLDLKERIAGISNFVITSVNGAAPANISLGSLQIFNKINWANVTLTIQKVY